MRVLITGGAGYIGSHAALAAHRAGHVPIILDSFVNSRRDVADRLSAEMGYDPVLVEADIRDADALARAFGDFDVSAVLHFAGLKAVGESASTPLEYYDVNVSGSVALLKAMRSAGVRRIIFSSSATVYGNPRYLPIDEDHPLSATNPYGASKLMVEDILRDAARADPTLSCAILRYFNPVGADPSGRIGESPSGVPANLVPFIVDVAAGARPHVGIFGDDYPTPDGTGVRDYIHVVDLAEAHLAALDWTGTATGARAFNLGVGQGTSVREMVSAFEAITHRTIPTRVLPRRPGDIATCYADATRAGDELGWRARRGIEEMCASAWHWRTAEIETPDTAA